MRKGAVFGDGQVKELTEAYEEAEAALRFVTISLPESELADFRQRLARLILEKAEIGCDRRALVRHVLKALPPLSCGGANEHDSRNPGPMNTDK